MKILSIKKGFDQVQNKDTETVKTRIWEALGIKHRTQWYQFLSGKREPRFSEAQKIEDVFSEVGITDIYEEVEA